MGSATAGLLFVIVVVIIAIVCFRYWLCREEGVYSWILGLLMSAPELSLLPVDRALAAPV